MRISDWSSDVCSSDLPLIEDAFAGIDRDELAAVGDQIAQATAAMAGFEEVQSLETRMAELFRAMSGPKQDVQPTLGFSATDALRINRQLRLLIDEGRRGIADASLGSANLIFLTLKLIDLQRLIAANRRDRSEEHTSELQSLMRTSYAVFCLKTKHNN